MPTDELDSTKPETPVEYKYWPDECRDRWTAYKREVDELSWQIATDHTSERSEQEQVDLFEAQHTAIDHMMLTYAPNREMIIEKILHLQRHLYKSTNYSDHREVKWLGSILSDVMSLELAGPPR